MCIIDLAKYMVIEAKKCYANTEHENTYSIYHDALTQITHESCIQWMKTTFVPGENTLVYNRFMFGKRWMGRLVGNTPEVMPLDTCLFQDVKESVRKHVAMSLTIREPGVKDDRLFLMTTPKDAWHAYSWVFDPQTGVAPTSKRILHDIHRVKNAWWEIFKAEGVYAPGLAGGRIARVRHVETTERSKRCGGKRVRMEFDLALDMLHRHVDLRQAWDEHGGDITSKFAMHDEENEDGKWEDND